MAGDTTFIVHSEWLDNIGNLSIEQQDKIIAEIIRYGTGKELAHADDAITQAFVNMVKGRIDYSKDKYAQKVEAGNNAGRKKKINDADVWNLAHNEGKRSEEIAEILECSKSAVDHSAGWKQRNEEIFFSF